jgi:hypothetical protein
MMNGKRFRMVLEELFPDVKKKWIGVGNYDIFFLRERRKIIEPHIPIEWIHDKGFIPAARRWALEDPERFKAILEFDEL